MRKKKKGPLILVIAVSLIAAFGFNSYIKKLQKEKQQAILMGAQNAANTQTAQVKGTKVYVAKIDIPVNVLIEDPMVELKTYPDNLLPGEGFFTEKDKVKILGKVAKLNLMKGDLLLKNKLTRPEDASNLSHNIPRGFRALTIEVDKVKSVAGFVRQGDYVDIVSSARVQGKMVTKTMLQNIKVLAIDHSFSTEPQLVEDPKTKQKTVPRGQVPKLVTLAVPLWAVEKILAVEKSGGKDGFRLVLKNYKDAPHKDDEGEPVTGTLVDTSGYSENELFSYALPEEASKVDDKSKRSGSSTIAKSVVRIHRGNDVRTIVLNN